MTLNLKLSNLRISSKLLIVIGVLALAMIGISVISVTSISALSDRTSDIDATGKEALLGAQLSQNVIKLNRAEYHVAADPSPAARKEIAKQVNDERKIVVDRLARLKKTANDTQLKLLEAVQSNYDAYVKELENTLRTADKLGDQTHTDAARDMILKSVLRSEAASNRLDQSVGLYADHSAKAASQTADEASSMASRTLVMVIVAATVATIVGAGLGFALSRFSISKPLATVVGCLRELAKGDLKVTIFGIGRKDEVGDIAEALQVFKDNLTETQRLQAEQREAEQRQAEMERQRETEKQATEAEKRAADERAKEERRKAMLDLADRFEAQVGKVVTEVSGAANQLQSTAGAMSATAEETSRQATAVAAAAEQASANVQTVASAAEELASSIAEIGRQVTQSSRISQNAVEAARTTDAKVQSLAEAANKIGEVVSLINDIASQTNLLALNATIEAARAGEAGKGFAVVAAEVKSLATQTAKATEEIAGQIGSIQTSTGDAVQAIQGIGKTIAEISEIASTIASAVEEQGAATREIAGNVQQAAAGTKDVTGNIGGVTQAASETGQATGQVLSAANTLVQHGEALKREVDDFLTTVRAA